MLERLSQVLKKATDKIASAIFVDKNLIDAVIKDLQRALLEADVNVVLVKQLTDKIKQTALDERIKGIEILCLTREERQKATGSNQRSPARESWEYATQTRDCPKT